MYRKKAVEKLERRFHFCSKHFQFLLKLNRRRTSTRRR
jgi:hypothetical protein